MRVVRKRILISQRVDIVDSYNERRDALDQKWAELLWEAGCAALPVPNHSRALSELLETLPVDGILLSGGNSPADYGGFAAERDETDRLLISFAAGSNIPLLGVCRGMQSVVLYFGGSLKKTEGHAAVRHVINFGKTRCVNSYHDYAPDLLSNDLSVLALSECGEIEGIRHRNLPIMGIMWHPERESPFDLEDVALIKEHMRV